MLIAQIDYLTRNAHELTRPMCFDLSRDARAAIACRTRPMCFPLYWERNICLIITIYRCSQISRSIIRSNHCYWERNMSLIITIYKWSQIKQI